MDQIKNGLQQQQVVMLSLLKKVSWNYLEEVVFKKVFQGELKNIPIKIKLFILNASYQLRAFHHILKAYFLSFTLWRPSKISESHEQPWCWNNDTWGAFEHIKETGKKVLLDIERDYQHFITYWNSITLSNLWAL